MKEQLQQWLERNFHGGNALACALRYADRSIVSQSRADGFSPQMMENTLHNVADLFQTLQLNRLDYGRVRWVYQNVTLHCERRPDGICLAVFTRPEVAEEDVAEIERFFQEFKDLKNGEAR